MNKIVEQDHRAILRRCSATHGFKPVPAATVAIAGIELAHRIRKHQFRLGRGRGRGCHSMQSAWVQALFGT
jgi:transposase-like protein